jgi:CubicO group peptidase (beta-lactamase class C family)
MKQLTIMFCAIFAMLSGYMSYAQTFPSQDWERVAQPTWNGWPSGELEELRSYVIDSTAITGMLIVHEGQVVFEYGNISENSYIASCRKSILAMLYGKYVNDGTINLDKTMSQLDLVESEQLLEIESQATIRDIISARSGIFLPASNRGDFLELAPERGSVRPGEFWLYSNYDFNMAGYIFERESNRNIYDEIESQLAIPLSMQDWDRNLQEKSGDRTVSEHMAYHMWFSARDMARLGLLMLNEGNWNGEQVLDANWVREMTTTKTSHAEVNQIAPFLKKDGGHYGYGYMWWLWDKPDNPRLTGAYSALGAWGQNITVFPKINTVLAIKTNDAYGRRNGNHNRIVERITKIFDEDMAVKYKELSTSLQEEDVDRFLVNLSTLNSSDEDVDIQDELNSLGYAYLRRDEFTTAIKIFEFNVEKYPEAWNVYDSVGEAYFMSGKYDEALQNYKKAIALNPDNTFDNNDRVDGILKRIELKKSMK